MLCKRCETLPWELKQTRKGTGGIMCRRAARQVNLDSHRGCKACKFFNPTIQQLEYSGIDIEWDRLTSKEYLIEFKVFGYRDSEKQIGKTYHQAVEIGPRYGLGMLNNPEGSNDTLLTLLQTDFNSASMNKQRTRDPMLASHLLAIGFSSVKRPRSGANNMDQRRVKAGTQQGWFLLEKKDQTQGCVRLA
jgi:hypothetical protein